jgi:hypothetical protein
VAEVLGDEAVEVGRVERRRLGRRDVPGRVGAASLEVPDDTARDRERVLVGGRVVVGDAGAPRVDVGAAELLCGHVLPVAAFTSGGPPMKIVPVPRTITVSSDIAGT